MAASFSVDSNNLTPMELRMDQSQGSMMRQQQQGNARHIQATTDTTNSKGNNKSPQQGGILHSSSTGASANNKNPPRYSTNANAMPSEERSWSEEKSWGKGSAASSFMFDDDNVDPFDDMVFEPTVNTFGVPSPTASPTLSQSREGTGVEDANFLSRLITRRATLKNLTVVAGDGPLTGGGRRGSLRKMSTVNAALLSGSGSLNMNIPKPPANVSQQPSSASASVSSPTTFLNNNDVNATTRVFGHSQVSTSGEEEEGGGKGMNQLIEFAFLSKSSSSTSSKSGDSDLDSTFSIDDEGFSLDESWMSSTVVIKAKLKGIEKAQELSRPYIELEEFQEIHYIRLVKEESLKRKQCWSTWKREIASVDVVGVREPLHRQAVMMEESAAWETLIHVDFFTDAFHNVLCAEEMRERKKIANFDYIWIWKFSTFFFQEEHTQREKLMYQEWYPGWQNLQNILHQQVTFFKQEFHDRNLVIALHEENSRDEIHEAMTRDKSKLVSLRDILDVEVAIRRQWEAEGIVKLGYVLVMGSRQQAREIYERRLMVQEENEEWEKNLQTLTSAQKQIWQKTKLRTESDDRRSMTDHETRTRAVILKAEKINFQLEFEKTEKRIRKIIAVKAQLIDFAVEKLSIFITEHESWMLKTLVLCAVGKDEMQRRNHFILENKKTRALIREDYINGRKVLDKQFAQQLLFEEQRREVMKAEAKTRKQICKAEHDGWLILGGEERRQARNVSLAVARRISSGEGNELGGQGAKGIGKPQRHGYLQSVQDSLSKNAKNRRLTQTLEWITSEKYQQKWEKIYDVLSWRGGEDREQEEHLLHPVRGKEEGAITKKEQNSRQQVYSLSTVAPCFTLVEPYHFEGKCQQAHQKKLSPVKDHHHFTKSEKYDQEAPPRLSAAASTKRRPKVPLHVAAPPKKGGEKLHHEQKKNNTLNPYLQKPLARGEEKVVQRPSSQQQNLNKKSRIHSAAAHRQQHWEVEAVDFRNEQRITTPPSVPKDFSNSRAMIQQRQQDQQQYDRYPHHHHVEIDETLSEQSLSRSPEPERKENEQPQGRSEGEKGESPEHDRQTSPSSSSSFRRSKESEDYSDYSNDFEESPPRRASHHHHAAEEHRRSLSSSSSDYDEAHRMPVNHYKRARPFRWEDKKRHPQGDKEEKKVETAGRASSGGARVPPHYLTWRPRRKRVSQGGEGNAAGDTMQQTESNTTRVLLQPHPPITGSRHQQKEVGEKEMVMESKAIEPEPVEIPLKEEDMHAADITAQAEKEVELLCSKTAEETSTDSEVEGGRISSKVAEPGNAESDSETKEAVDSKKETDSNDEEGPATNKAEEGAIDIEAKDKAEELTDGKAEADEAKEATETKVDEKSTVAKDQEVSISNKAEKAPTDVEMLKEKAEEPTGNNKAERESEKSADSKTPRKGHYDSDDFDTDEDPDGHAAETQLDEKAENPSNYNEADEMEAENEVNKASNIDEEDPTDSKSKEGLTDVETKAKIEEPADGNAESDSETKEAVDSKKETDSNDEEEPTTNKAEEGGIDIEAKDKSKEPDVETKEKAEEPTGNSTEREPEKFADSKTPGKGHYDSDEFDTDEESN